MLTGYLIKGAAAAGGMNIGVGSGATLDLEVWTAGSAPPSPPARSRIDARGIGC